MATFAVRRKPVREALAQRREAIATTFGKGDLPETEQWVDEHASQMAIGFRALRRTEAPA